MEQVATGSHAHKHCAITAADAKSSLQLIRSSEHPRVSPAPRKTDVTCTTDAATHEDGHSVFEEDTRRNTRPRERLPTQFKQNCQMNCLREPADAVHVSVIGETASEVICERDCADTVSDDDTTQSARESVRRVHSM